MTNWSVYLFAKQHIYLHNSCDFSTVCSNLNCCLTS